MTKTKSTKRALLLSALSLLMCVSMLIGSTFAWFTDSVTSSGNIIKSGTLDVEMYWAEGTEAPDTAVWKDASTGAIFNYDLWEPGYTEVRHIKIENKGSLALKYQINIIANGEVSKLADVIDVYYVDPAVQVANRTDLAAAPKLGTLTEVLDAINTSASGNLLAGENDTITLALKMQESAGNEYQGLAIGSDFSVQLLATQLTYEEDSFDNQYDLGAEFDVAAKTADELATALKAGGKVKLANDIAVDEVIVIPEGVVSYLDLNGKALSSANVTSTYALNNLGTLTIYDSSSKASAKARSTQNGTGSISARGIYNGYSADGNNVTTAKLTVLSGDFNAMGTNGGAAIYNYGEVVVTGGDFESNGGYGLNNQYGKMTISNANVRGGIYNTGELTINNSTVYQHISGRHAIYNWTGSVIVNGGEFDSESGNELILADGTNASVVINDGTFNKTAKSWLFGAATNKNITFAINGGTFNGYVNKPENTVDTIRPYGDKFDITGGTFNFDPTKWVVDGYIAINNGNGTYTVVKGVAVNDSASLKNAIANGEKEIYAYGVVVEGTSQLNTGATIVGATFKASGTAVTQTVSGTFKDCVFEGSEPLRWCYSNAGETVVFENCEIKTTLRGVHFDDMKGDVVFKNCKINGFNAIGGDGTVTFEKCTFGNDRSSYNGLNMYSNINLIDCTFNFESGKTNFIDMEGVGKTLTITNCKAFLDGTATDIRNFVGGSKLAQNTVVYN